ncbi:MAG: hypothetical protein VKL59_09650 [Nostocaceae cyanobacterium]|nr:hypothetical protein [Nostocaceae cyanobacterium]
MGFTSFNPTYKNTHPSIYEALKVPELWRFDKGKLQINILLDGRYIESQSSLNFPTFPLVDVIPQYLEESRIAGRNSTLKAFRHWVRERMQ